MLEKVQIIRALFSNSIRIEDFDVKGNFRTRSISMQMFVSKSHACLFLMYIVKLRIDSDPRIQRTVVKLCIQKIVVNCKKFHCLRTSRLHEREQVLRHDISRVDTPEHVSRCFHFTGSVS